MPTDYRDRIYQNYVSRYLAQTTTVRYTYDEKFYADWARVTIGRIRRLLPKQKDAAICEVACGHGGLFYALKKFGYTNMVGVDISAEQIELAQTIWPNVILGDAVEFLQSHSENFDLIVAFDFLEHFRKEEILPILDVFYAALQPGGRVILSTSNDESPLSTYCWEDFTHEVCFTSNSIKQILQVVGFEDVRTLPAEPVPHGVFSAVRWVLWQGFKALIYFYNLVETSRPGSGVFTRGMIATAIRPFDEDNIRE
ncbi:MAG: class I SAM-dependent methyltransferase [Chloroflexi bacterium]|nr:class I SAM-dependent methyltransferase [Chloroflexota bacterium]